MTSDSDAPASPQVLIAGGGPVGLTLAALLVRHGIRCLVIEADAGYCTGSRAICVSRRSQEILGWVGADRAVVAAGLSWVGGRSHFRDAEVLHFRMPSEPGERFAPMVNLQQYRIEQFAHEALLRGGELGSVLWSTRMGAVRNGAQGVQVDVETADGTRQTITAPWLVACDGGRSTVREALGLQLEGTTYEGRYVIVDIEQQTQREVERLAWFDPPSNPGSTILMHRQPENVWRIDYQIRDDEDPLEAVKPENVLPRVQSHLQMIGETAPWRPLWISIYNAKCLSLQHYRHERVLFAGDAAHLVPIFGVRGLNSGLDDAGNLAWKLAWVLKHGSEAALLDSYSDERVQAARENMAYGAKSTEFMAPPNFAFKLMRDATLRLAAGDAAVRSLIDPRQTLPCVYEPPLLNAPDADAAQLPPATAPGRVAPDAALTGPQGACHLTQQFGGAFTLLYFSRHAPPRGLAALACEGAVQLCVIGPADAPRSERFADVDGHAWARYGAVEGSLYLVRPDGYVLARWRAGGADAAAALLARLAPQPAEATA